MHRAVLDDESIKMLQGESQVSNPQLYIRSSRDGGGDLTRQGHFNIHTPPSPPTTRQRPEVWEASDLKQGRMMAKSIPGYMLIDGL